MSNKQVRLFLGAMRIQLRSFGTRSMGYLCHDLDQAQSYLPSAPGHRGQIDHAAAAVTAGYEEDGLDHGMKIAAESGILGAGGSASRSSTSTPHNDGTAQACLRYRKDATLLSDSTLWLVDS